MKFDAYRWEALRTERKDLTEPIKLLSAPPTVRLLHAALGLATETGELCDAIKRAVYYGRELDRTNVIEELGDLCWYLALAIDALGVNWDTVLEANIRKLCLRYGAEFRVEKAVNRDVEAERRAVEDNNGGPTVDGEG